MSNNYPHEISEKFQEVYKKYFENNSDPKTALMLIDQFLEEVPFYPEALIFKARMLLALGKNKKALNTIELAEKYDKWRLLGKFDKAEAYLENNETKRSISEFINAINLYQNELQNGVESYLLSLSDFKNSEIIKEKVFDYLSLCWADPDKKDEYIKNLENYLIKNEKEIKSLKIKS